VSPTHFVTAAHVVKKTHQKDEFGHEYILKEIYYAPNDHLPVSDFIEIKRTKFPTLELPKEKFVDSLPQFDRLYLGDTENPWKMKNDFVFLKAREPVSENIGIAFPHTNGNPAGRCFVVGYPNSIAPAKYQQDYHDGPDTLVFYYEVQQLMGGFDRKVISFADDFSPSIGQTDLDRHHCPTIRGTSGGLFSFFDASAARPLFHGIHLGGSQTMKNNFSLPVSKPEFALEFAYQILEQGEHITFIFQYKDLFKAFFTPHKTIILKHFPNLEKIFDELSKK
jgi:hypothetical protein